MESKKLTIKRIIIFYVLAFLPLAVLTPLATHYVGEYIYASEKENAMAIAYALGVFGMFAPTIANLLTRWMTKEGMKDSYLAMHMEGNGKYYLAAVGVKLLEVVMEVFLIWKVFFGDVPFSEMFSGEDLGQKTALLLLQIAISIVLFFPAFGEEWGWRGYLGPKLEQVMSKPAAILVGGILWGLWHAPVTMAGHNFGVDYPYFPWVGIGFMCLMCTCFNAFLTLLTERTKSIYPAAFCHMVNNNCGAGVLFLLFASESVTERFEGISQLRVFATMIPVFLLVGIVSFILYMKKTKAADS